MQLTGKIHEIGNTQIITDKFKKREFVLEYIENPNYQQYPDHIKLQFINDSCELLNNYAAGDEVEVHFNLKGKKWENPQGETVYFNTLQAWKITNLNASESTQESKGVQVPSTASAAPTANPAQPAGGKSSGAVTAGNATIVDEGMQGEPEDDLLPF